MALEWTTLNPALKALVIDDCEPDRVALKRYLSRFDEVPLTVFESDNGEDGLTLCLKAAPDIILLDYLLPDIDGLEFLQALKAQMPSPPPVIMLTGEGNESVAVEAMKLGVEDYITKAKLNPETLIDTMRRTLKRQHLQALVSRQQLQQKLMTDIALRINQSLSIETVLEIAVEGTRRLLGCDRALIYQFESDMSGTIVAESVLPGMRVGKGAKIEDTCFQSRGAAHYLRGHQTVIANIYESHLTPCHIKLLEQFQVKANIVVPILLQSSEASSEQIRLWGLLIAHHCRDTRNWQDSELGLMDDMAVQLAIAIRQSELVSALRDRAARLTKMNTNLKRLSRALERRNQELDEFAYVASHDLRAPLRAISNLANWLQEDLADQIPEDNQHQLDLMQSRVKRMDGFIEGLLEYSRAGRQTLDAAPVDTAQLVREILDSLSPPLSFRITVAESMPTIVTQKLLLQQVLSNLISNAIKYHDRPDGHIHISAKDQSTMVEFAVKDDGPGIEPQYQDRIFGIFQTLNSRDSVESTGIGLSIVKKLVEKQSGTISLQSVLGEGSTFSFTWPKHTLQDPSSTG